MGGNPWLGGGKVAGGGGGTDQIDRMTARGRRLGRRGDVRGGEEQRELSLEGVVAPSRRVTQSVSSKSFGVASATV